MAGKSIFVLLFLQLSLILQYGCEAQWCKRIDAAVVQDNTLYLFFGSEYVAFDPEKRKEIDRGQIKDLYEGFPDDSHIDAAMVVPEGGTVLLTGGTYTLYQDGTHVEHKGDISEYLMDRTYFADSIDTAETIGKRNLFSKGCQGLQEKEIDGGTELSDFSLNEIGLPCFLDAGVVYDNQIYLAKGEYVWIMDASFKVSGPFCYASYLDTDYDLCKCETN